MGRENPADVSARENLEKQKSLWGKGENLVLTVVCVVFFLGMTLLFFLLPKASYSKTENRELASLPELTFEKENEKGEEYKGAAGALESVNKGIKAFNKGLVSFVKDHFPFRDGYMAVDALYKLGVGRMGSGGVIVASDGYLLTEERPAGKEELKQLKARAFVISALCGKIPSTVAVAGKGSEVMLDKFPDAIDLSPIDGNRRAINAAFEDRGIDYIDLTPVLRAHTEEDVYFRTDHHWTALGAYYGSAEILARMGIEPAPLGDYTKEVVLTDFKGTVYNRSGMFFHGGEELAFMRYEGDESYTVTFCDTDGSVLKTAKSLYDLSCLDADYKGTAYDAFVAPVSVPVVKIEKKGAERPTLLIVKDSFAHCAIPYFARYFNVISVDLRTNPDYAASLIESGAVDRLLILVNTETLFS